MFTKKNALKLVGLQTAIIFAVMLTQMVMVFFSQNKILVIVPKNDEKSFYGLYASAKTDYLSCNEQLQAFKDLRTANNLDILK